MKTNFLFTLLLVLGLSAGLSAQSSVADPDSEYDYPYVEVVATQEKIWLMPDELPVNNLPVRVVNADGIPVLKKIFCSKTKDWSLDVNDLPSGKYRILIGDRQVEYLEKQGRKGIL